MILIQNSKFLKRFTDNADNASALTLEANGHVVEQGTTHTKKLDTNKKRKKKPEEITTIS